VKSRVNRARARLAELLNAPEQTDVAWTETPASDCFAGAA
jgi:hypothetical protein